MNLAKDFNPGYKAGFVKKRDGRQLLRTGIALLADHQRRLADHQRRLAAPDTYGVLMYRPAVEADAGRQALAGRR